MREFFNQPQIIRPRALPPRMTRVLSDNGTPLPDFDSHFQFLSPHTPTQRQAPEIHHLGPEERSKIVALNRPQSNEAPLKQSASDRPSLLLANQTKASGHATDAKKTFPIRKR